MSQAAPGKLRYGHPETRHQRRERQGDFVPYPAGGMFIRGGTRQGAKIQALPGVNHRLGPVENLALIHALEEHRHRQGRHLFASNPVAGVGIDDPINLSGR